MSKDITVFTTRTCPYCIDLKSELDELGIKYNEIDVDDSEEWYQNMLSRSGQDVVPQVWIGKDIVVGDNIEEVKRLLKN